MYREVGGVFLRLSDLKPHPYPDETQSCTIVAAFSFAISLIIRRDANFGIGLIDNMGNGEIHIQNLTETGMLEKKPDLYIVLESESDQSSIKIKSNKIFDDVDFADAENRTVDLGEIKI